MVSMLVLVFNMVAILAVQNRQIYLSACERLSVEEEQKVSVDSKLKEHSSHRHCSTTLSHRSMATCTFAQPVFVLLYLL